MSAERPREVVPRNAWVMAASAMVFGAWLAWWVFLAEGPAEGLGQLQMAMLFLGVTVILHGAVGAALSRLPAMARKITIAAVLAAHAVVLLAAGGRSAPQFYHLR